MPTRTSTTEQHAVHTSSRRERYFHVVVGLVSKLIRQFASKTDRLTMLPADLHFPRVEPRGFEPLTSAAQRRRASVLDLSGGCKIAAKAVIFVLCKCFFQAFRGVTQVAARLLHYRCARQRVSMTLRRWTVLKHGCVLDRSQRRSSSWCDRGSQKARLTHHFGVHRTRLKRCC